METNRSREAEVGWSLSLTPRGHLVVEAATGPGGLVGPAAPAILEAFRRGEGNGLFHLGAGETRTELPPSWSFFRDVALLWVTRRCLTPEAGGGGEEVAAPTIELAALVSAVPPMPGAEYLTQETLLGLWTTIGRAFDDEFRASGATLQEFLHERNPVWNVVGRVHFHLAERKDDERMPFAFLATYTSGAGRAGRPVHRALGSAVNASATARDHAALLSLLAPVHRAAEASPLVRSLVDSGEIFRPLAWRPAQAFAFLQELPAIEGAGVVVKVPDWWQRRRASGPTVQISIGAKEPAGVGADAILDFDVAVGIDGERLDAAALRELLANCSVPFPSPAWC